MDAKIDMPPVYGEVCLRKQRRKRQKLLLIELFFDFAKNTTLHGLRYITEKGLTVIEKLFWFLTFLMSAGICFYLIRNVYIKWQTSPVIVSFSEQMVPVGKVPFPSVTICPQLKSKSSVYNFSDEYTKHIKFYDTENVTMQSSREKMEDISHVCGVEEDVSMPRNFSNASFVKHIDEVAPKIEDVFHYCSWQDESFECEQIFIRVLTREGICYNFNALAADEIFHKKNMHENFSYLDTTERSRNWTVLDGYTNADTNSYPRRGRENGAKPDLEVILRELPTDRDNLCNTVNIGFKIYVQHPADLPQSSLYYYAALPNQVSSLALKFDMMTTSASLKDYSPQVRQCYFPSDRPLRYFRIYTSNNCRLECQSNFTFQRCGCVAFHMPHYNSQHICTAEDVSCVRSAQDYLAIEEMKADPSADSRACRCLPACYNVRYDAEILKTIFDFRTLIKTYSKIYQANLTELESYNHSKIEIYFKEPHFVSMRRTELFGLTDFLANCGGLLGLFLGFSILSLVEIVYFVTLRLCCTLRRDLQAEKSDKRRE